MIDRREYGLGTYLDASLPFGWYRGGRAICSDGRVRQIARIAETADTFFSVPAAVKVGGRTVSGYVSVETARGYSTETEGDLPDLAVVKFIAYQYGRNAALLPAGAWRETDGAGGDS